MRWCITPNMSSRVFNKIKVLIYFIKYYRMITWYLNYIFQQYKYFWQKCRNLQGNIRMIKTDADHNYLSTKRHHHYIPPLLSNRKHSSGCSIHAFAATCYIIAGLIGGGSLSLLNPYCLCPHSDCLSLITTWVAATVRIQTYKQSNIAS